MFLILWRYGGIIHTNSFKAFINYGSPFFIAENRGRHEAELWNEDIRYMRFPKGPNFCKSGIGILQKGEVIP
ncbi:hypothetical protein T4B_4430 [Trichinella pseudospiralis]|uniref:Uncharacterized protein n=1 Tax=Trichinella pseudospiralis TaxID=6337 RepID=A0A0V1IN50_TRIPS|nr:hypothetical protein T4B_4430 [Trichinella pseudospiralis]